MYDIYLLACSFVVVQGGRNGRRIAAFPTMQLAEDFVASLVDALVSQLRQQNGKSSPSPYSAAR